MKPFVLVAAAAMALASCQKNEMPAPEKQDVHFTINAGIETKTSITETVEEDKTVYKAQWDGNEELGVLFAAPNADTKAEDIVKLTNAETGYVASFQGNVTLTEENQAGTFYAFYPAVAFNRGYTEGDARLDLKNAQKPTATSFDPTCDILVAKPYDYTVEEGAVVADGLEFTRIMSVLRIDLKSEFADVQNEFVESVSFTAGDVAITGYARIFLDNPEFTGNWASSGNQWHTVTANYDSDLVSINGATNSVYLVIAPVTIPANKDLTFEIKTKNYKISKTVKSPEMKFTAGKVSKINLAIASDNCEKIDQSIDYSGEYLIAGKEGSKWYAAKKYVSGDYLAVSEIEFVDENIVETETISDHYMTITKVVGGDYDGMYTIVDADGNYLSTSSSSSNNMKAVSSTSAHTYWTIVKDDEKGTYSIVASKSEHTRNDMRFNYNGGTNARVSCYDGTKTAQPYLALFSTSLVKPDTTPKLELGDEPIELTAAGGEGTINVTAKNLPAEIRVRALTAEDAQEEVNWLTVTYADGKITYTATANESEDARTAYIEAYVSDDLKDGVVVTQAGKVAENVPVHKSVTYTVASTSSVTVSGDAPENASATYSSTYTTKCQLTANNSMTFTLSGYDGCTIEGVTLSMKSNSKGGAGNLSITVGSKAVSSISTAKFNTGSWYGSWSTSYVDVKPAVTSSVVGNGEKIVVKIAATENSLYCQSITIDYLTASTGSEGGETPEPEEPNPGTGGETTSVEETLNIFANKGTLSGSTSISWSGTYFTCTNVKGSTAIRTSDSDHYRVYANSTLKFTSNDSKSLNKVVITCTSSDYANVFQNATITGGTVSVSGSIVTITASGNVTEISAKVSAQTRINKVVATLQ